MTQELYNGQKAQPVILCPLDDSTVHGVSVPSHPDAQSEKGDSAAFDSDLRDYSQDDYPDGGLQAWLTVLGVSLQRR
jgi:hypothetical protein